MQLKNEVVSLVQLRIEHGSGCVCVQLQLNCWVFVTATIHYGTGVDCGAGT